MRKSKNWNQPCPNRDCPEYGIVNKGNIRSISTYKTRSGKRRIFHCTTCGKTFSETRDTVFFDLKVPEEKVIMALKMILVRTELSDIKFVLGIKEETLLSWLRRASEKAEEINQYLLKNVETNEVQLDEMWTFVKKKLQTKSKENMESNGFGSAMHQNSDSSSAPS